MFECDNNVLVCYKGGRVFSGQKLIKKDEEETSLRTSTQLTSDYIDSVNYI